MKYLKRLLEILKIAYHEMTRKLTKAEKDELDSDFHGDGGSL